MNLRKILFATEFNELTLDAVRSLLDLKQAGMEEILLTHIIPRDEVAFVPYGGYLKDEEERLREEARIRFEDWQDDIMKAGVGARVFIEVGDPVPEILKIAETEKVALIVSGRTKRKGLEKVYVSSHTLELLRRSTTIPVLVSKHMVSFDIEGEAIRRLNEHPFHRPLFAVDGSKPSERALQFIVTLKGALQKVDVAHVVVLKGSKDNDPSEWKRIEAEGRDLLDGYCDILRKAGIEGEPHLVAGDAASEILRLSRELNSTMTILGTTGKDRVHAFFLGSLSQHLAETSDVPTLLIP
jgi:nucleotide-binding universal stress UspA family protein